MSRGRATRLKPGDVVLVWDTRRAVVRKVNGQGSKVWSSGDHRTRLPIVSPVYPKGRVLVELLDGRDPPAGYSAWWPAGELQIAEPLGQLELFSPVVDSQHGKNRRNDHPQRTHTARTGRRKSD